MTKKLKQLKTDPNILDLRPVNPVFVSRYRQAMRSGDKFPPLIIDKEGAIVAGNHRFAAYSEEFSPDHEVEVIVKSYKTAADRVEDAIRDNARHGNPLDGITRKRAILKLSELGRTAEAIGKVLGISAKRVEELAGISVIVVGGGTQPVKRGLEHISGKTVTASEYAEHRQCDRGVPAAQSARQLIRWMENGWIDWKDADTFNAMSELRDAIATHTMIDA